MSENATDRLARVLSMVPYIARRPGIHIEDLAAEFGVDAEQVGRDLDLLMVSGLPGYYPDDLIDVVLSDDGTEVSIGFDAGLERPVRLTADEAVALTVALRALGENSGLLAGDAVTSALAKLEAATGALEGQPAGPAPIDVVPGDESPMLATVRQAVGEQRQLWMRYYTASRDEFSERTVDPLRVMLTDGHTYLEAHCHLVGAVRQFRVDRIVAATVLDQPSQPPLWVDEEVPERMYHPDPQVPPSTLLLYPDARWVAEYYLADEVTELPAGDPAADGTDGTDGMVVVRLRTPGDEWLVRLMVSHGGDVVVLDRPDLVRQAATRAGEALALYS